MADGRTRQTLALGFHDLLSQRCTLVDNNASALQGMLHQLPAQFATVMLLPLLPFEFAREAANRQACRCGPNSAKGLDSPMLNSEPPKVRNASSVPSTPKPDSLPEQLFP
jgi:hypothetical protein